MFISVVLAAVYSDYFTAVYILYLMWLMVMAYVDYYTGYVYVKMEYAVIVPVILCIISLFNTSYNKEHIEAAGNISLYYFSFVENQFKGRMVWRGRQRCAYMQLGFFVSGNGFV